jgi:hypothetical protein
VNDVTTNAPTVPTWLNLDAIVPPDVRSAAFAFADELEKFAADEHFVNLMRGTYNLVRDICAREDRAGVHDLSPSIDAQVDELTGRTAIFEALNRINGMVRAAYGELDLGDIGEDSAPEWYEQD